MQLALGTVQLGVPYGNKSHLSVMPEEQAFAILEAAIAAGIRYFDTAIAYGLSEERIGRFELAKKSPGSVITTKIPVAPPELWQNENEYWKWLMTHRNQSLQRLKLEQHDLLQFHQCDLAFLSSPHVKQTLNRLVEENLCLRVGISVYDPSQALAALDIPAVKSLQVPVNLIDTRFLAPEFQFAAKQRGVELTGRSLFLQGVLVDSAPLPEVLRKTELASLRRTAVEISEGQSLQELSVRFVYANHSSSLDNLLLGIDSVESLRQNLSMFKNATQAVPESQLKGFKALQDAALESKLYNPATWNQAASPSS